ncbi:MAG TPA: hypothetical protein VG028_06195 [Terriglobia bacterium]|nr:hypothetical protein [Terriglobia bacterium]
METNHILFRTLFLDNEAIRDGHFVFTQWFHSRFLIDFGRVLHDTRSSNKLLAKMFEPFRGESVTKVITPNITEGYVLAHGVAKKFNAKVYRADRREGIIYTPTDLEISTRDKVLLVDDGINTGNSMRQLLSDIAKAGATCCGITVCISRCPFPLSDFGVRVETIFDLSTTYPIVNTQVDNCDQCATLGIVAARLDSEPLEKEKERLMFMKVRLKPTSAYAEWPSSTVD